MYPFQQRIIDEKAALDEKLAKLNTFMSTNSLDKLPPEEVERMRRQRRIMTEYSDVLWERIVAFQLQEA